MAERRHVDDVGIGRVDANLRDRLRVGEADVRPRLAGVDRFVDAVALHDVAADARLPHSNEDDVRVCFGNGDGADRRALELPVRHRIPGLSTVGRLPESATDGAEVILVNPRAAGGGDRPASSHRADVAPLQRFEECGIGSGRLRRGKSNQSDRADQRQRERQSDISSRTRRHETSCG